MPLAVNPFVLGPFRSNCYVVRSERGAPEAAIVDPGDDPTALRLELAGMGTRPAGILVTHTDVDHIGGVAALADGTGAEVWAPAGEVEALRTGQAARGLPRRRARSGAHRHGRRRDHRRRASTSRCSTCRGTPRATSRSARATRLFSGDLLFAGSVGRVDLDGGDWETLLASVRSLIERFPPETVIHPGHGPATTLGRELQSNPFLRELRAEPQA